MLLFVAPTATFAVGNAQEQSEGGINEDAVLKAMNAAMKDWRHRVETYRAAAKAESRQVSPDLRRVWDRAKAASQRVAIANETVWDRAQSEVERELAALKADRQ